jgi:hypothetical protein
MAALTIRLIFAYATVEGVVAWVRGPCAGGSTHFVVTVAGGGEVSPRGGSFQSLSVADSSEEAHSPNLAEGILRSWTSALRSSRKFVVCKQRPSNTKDSPFE